MLIFASFPHFIPSVSVSASGIARCLWHNTFHDSPVVIDSLTHEADGEQFESKGCFCVLCDQIRNGLSGKLADPASCTHHLLGLTGDFPLLLPAPLPLSARPPQVQKPPIKSAEGVAKARPVLPIHLFYPPCSLPHPPHLKSGGLGGFRSWEL
ncbi:hypothetical protein NN561_019631 [Cricetulus griseus]